MENIELLKKRLLNYINQINKEQVLLAFIVILAKDEQNNIRVDGYKKAGDTLKDINEYIKKNNNGKNMSFLQAENIIQKYAKNNPLKD